MEDVKELIYDVETYKNFFCNVLKYKGKYKVFEISSRKDDSLEMYRFLKKNKNYYFTGFNNVKFDAQVLELFIKNIKDFEFLDGEQRANKMYEYAQLVIDKSRNGEFPPFTEHKLTNKQIDLFLINHYNNMARMTSLKWLEFRMNWKKVQDLPYHHTAELEESMFDPVIVYCKNDVDATEEFRGHCEKIVSLRFSQVKQYDNEALRNKSDSSIGEYIFLDKMSDYLGVDKKELRSKRTHRSSIKFKDIILPYIQFKTVDFQRVLEKFKTIEITSENPTFAHSVNYQGMKYDLGLGGLHASRVNTVYNTDSQGVILDSDAASYYPNLSIVNKFYPEHLSEDFCTVYKNIYEERKSIPKSNPNNTSLKLTLNSAYGKSNDKFSFLYDPQFTYSITVNGQLLLLMIAEQISLLEGSEIIQCNTDGFTYKVRHQDREKAMSLINDFEKLTGLDFEHAVYNQMVLRDVNSYIAEYEDGKVKYKGCFEIDSDFHKNASQRIVPLAMSEYYIKGIPIEETIKNHLSGKDYEGYENKGIFDFMVAKKSNNKVKCYRNLKGAETVDYLDKVIRFYASKDGGKLFKMYEKLDVKKNLPGQLDLFSENTDPVNHSEGVLKGYKVSMMMDYEEKEDYKVDYNYYINECKKITSKIK